MISILISIIHGTNFSIEIFIFRDIKRERVETTNTFFFPFDFETYDH